MIKSSWGTSFGMLDDAPGWPSKIAMTLSRCAAEPRHGFLVQVQQTLCKTAAGKRLLPLPLSFLVRTHQPVTLWIWKGKSAQVELLRLAIPDYTAEYSNCLLCSVRSSYTFIIAAAQTRPLIAQSVANPSLPSTNCIREFASVASFGIERWQ